MDRAQDAADLTGVMVVVNGERRRAVAQGTMPSLRHQQPVVVVGRHIIEPFEIGAAASGLTGGGPPISPIILGGCHFCHSTHTFSF